MSDFTLLQGSVPLLVSLPHDGVEIPADIAATMSPGALRVPLEELGQGEMLDRGRPVVVFCEIGRRSMLAAERLHGDGIAARSLEGGIVAWTAAGLDLTP